MHGSVRIRLGWLVAIGLVAIGAVAQQQATVAGRVLDSTKAALAGVTVEATSGGGGAAGRRRSPASSAPSHSPHLWNRLTSAASLTSANPLSAANAALVISDCSPTVHIISNRSSASGSSTFRARANAP
jgi:hypothetical protein